MTTDQRQSGIAERIAALLAKAESSTFPAERDAFTEKAAALMNKHNIDQLVLNRAKAGQAQTANDPIDKIAIVFDHTAYHIGFLDMMTAVGEAFGFKIVWRNDRKAGWWYGFASELEQAEAIYASLLIQCSRAAKRYMDEPAQKALARFKKHVAKRAFISGFGRGAGAKIVAGRQIGEDEATVEHGAENVLPVLASRSDQLDVYFNETVMPRLGRSNKRGHQADYGASGAGYNAGQRADVGQSRVGGNRALTG